VPQTNLTVVACASGLTDAISVKIAGDGIAGSSVTAGAASS
jgi:hypothetical protein